jgi:hypothetical protein
MDGASPPHIVRAAVRSAGPTRCSVVGAPTRGLMDMWAHFVSSSAPQLAPYERVR